MTTLSAQIGVPLSPTTAYSGDAFSQSRKRFDMQALPFDDTDLTTPVSAPPSSWIDTSPRVPIVTSQQQHVIDDDIYRLVGAPSPPNPNEELISRYSHVPQFSQRQQQQQQHAQHPQHPHLSHQSTATSTSTLPQLHRPPAMPQQISRHNLNNSPPRPSRLPPPHPLQQQPQQQQARKLARSAVEEARIRAQREAESFANMRRETPKRDMISVANEKDIETGRVKKRIRTESIEVKRTPVVGVDESDMEKQQRYRRRLDMNRESAAVSRVRRKAYVSELEKRLATVEAEKLQLEGKLEMLMQQNEGYKKQLENLFLMVASGRRPSYPGSLPHAGSSPHTSSAQQAQNPPPQPPGPPS